jgi:putative endonuclease
MSTARPEQTARRRAAYRRGRRSEALAVWLLRLKGYRILARGLRSHLGEIDIVAARGKTVVFVEVKARGEVAQAAEALSRRQQGRIVRATSAFLAQRPRLANHQVRFDVILLTPGALPRHIADAWRPGL